MSSYLQECEKLAEIVRKDCYGIDADYSEIERKAARFRTHRTLTRADFLEIVDPKIFGRFWVLPSAKESAESDQVEVDLWNIRRKEGEVINGLLSTFRYLEPVSGFSGSYTPKSLERSALP